ncbi:hypothetical protein ROZALSC1DRAFT_28633 [Rozella allomycis CSF55]|uniref:Uncharacterized protein n=1 Tax=Rozella allomycis (strain CSF55) TaxID=988480 RepID=A0A075B2V0_ROZAC|nr:hypothetical protein O9G_003778 [Rozella allomycis CSF55]RKP19818.1 hypothetical protein ROZALSC1DRAFT_28633 [Rozella allomycis CSF55]|eukprot:EPZ36664.1 hypothetical protein O9G_003778 [Rozella allomycis CSF55]
MCFLKRLKINLIITNRKCTSHWTVHTVVDALKALKLANNENDTANDENNKDSSDEDDDH